MSGDTAAMPPPRPAAQTAPAPTAAATAALPRLAAPGRDAAPAGEPGSTPRALRRWRAAVLLGCALLGALGWLDAGARSTAAQELVGATGPVLADTQSLRAALAEADAAQAVALVGQLERGFEDGPTRRAYEDALARASRLVEQIAARLGTTLDEAGTTSDAQERLVDVAELLPRYAGLVEAARAAAPLDQAAAEDRLVEAIAFVRGDLDGALDAFAQAVDLELALALAEQDGLPLLAALGAALALLAVVLASGDLSRRTRRTLNPGLVVTTMTVIGALVWLQVASSSADDEVARAIDAGFRSITATAELQRAGFTVQSLETLDAAGVDADLTLLRASRAEVDGRLDDLISLADTPREVALAAEVAQRWQRIGDEPALTAGRSAAFNGFVFAAEGVLADNRDDLLDGIGAASDALAPLPLGLVALGLLAAAAAVAGYRPRLDEYR